MASSKTTSPGECAVVDGGTAIPVPAAAAVLDDEDDDFDGGDLDCETDPTALAATIEAASVPYADPATGSGGSYDPYNLAADLGNILRRQCRDVVGFGAAMVPNTSNYVGVYRCNHSWRSDSPWCVEARKVVAGSGESEEDEPLPGQGLIAWITYHPDGEAGPGNIALMKFDGGGDETGSVLPVSQDDFFYEDGYDLTWPPASAWYLDAVRPAATNGG